MAHINYNEFIANKLIKQGYANTVANRVTLELIKVDSALSPLVERWLDGDEADFESHGYSILGLMKSRSMTYPAALLTIDWLIKDPEAAKKSLEKGIK